MFLCVGVALAFSSSLTFAAAARSPARALTTVTRTREVAELCTHVRPSAVEALGRSLTLAEVAAVERAHLIGLGEPGAAAETSAYLGNYTYDQIAEKARELHAAGFESGEVRVLMESGVAGLSKQTTAHHSITADLYNGNVVWSRSFSKNGNNTQLYQVRVHNPKTGRHRDALFKPRVWGDNQGYNRTPAEYAAYRINRMLGMDYVPPVAYRRNIEVGGQRWSEGALIYRVPDAHNLRNVPVEQWGVRRKLLLSDARILDVLIQNSDRHVDNFIRGRHWVDGSYRPILIDNAAGFRREASVRLSHQNAFGTGRVRVIRKATYENLKKLSRRRLKRELGEFLSDREIDALLRRRDGIVAYFDTRIEKYGYTNVVWDVSDF